MAARARLVPPPPAPSQWKWHKAQWGGLSSSLLKAGDRRMEAECYLSAGYGLRLAIEQSKSGWQRLSAIAKVWQPNRLKGILVAAEHGTPFLAATQVFDVRPSPRKWLSVERTPNSDQRFVKNGLIMVTCSGAVGRTTMSSEAHIGKIISHDLLRIEPQDTAQWGWVYGYLRSPQARAMMNGAQYGHIIKHLETSHLDALPIPSVSPEIARRLKKSVQKILDLRDASYRDLAAAEAMFEEKLGGKLAIKNQEEQGFSVSTSAIFGGRRRLEGAYHSPAAREALKRLSKFGKRVDVLKDVSKGVWWLPRFKRVFGGEGVPYMSADEMFTINPSLEKRVLINQDEDHSQYFLKEGWIAMACSGQVYGLNGAAMLATKHHEKFFFSHDLIRIRPDELKIASGYLLTALTHPVFGRPVLIREAYGTSIPHLDPGDVGRFPVVRLDKKSEGEIAEAAFSAAEQRAKADEMDRSIATEAGELIDRFIKGDSSSFTLL